MKIQGTNHYIDSRNVLIFPSSKLRHPPEHTPISYPDGRRFSEYNVIQLINSLIDYADISCDGFICDYTLSENGTALQDCTFVVHGYIFRIINQDIKLYDENNTPISWYASIIVHKADGNTLVQQTEGVIRVTDVTDEYFPEGYCDGIILTNGRPVVQNDTLINIEDPTTYKELTLGTATLYTLPLVVEGKINTHKFSSKSIKNIDGGTC